MILESSEECYQGPYATEDGVLQKERARLGASSPYSSSGSSKGNGEHCELAQDKMTVLGEQGRRCALIIPAV